MTGFKAINAPMWDQMQVFCKHISDHQIRFILYFNRALDERILKEAVKVTIENNPIACTNYVEDEKRPSWKFSDINMDKIFSFQQSREPEKLLQEAVLKQIDTCTGPQLEISLIRSEGDILVLNVDHAISDAGGVKDFAYQLSGNYSNIAQNKTVAKQNYVSKRSLKVLMNKLSFKEKWSVGKQSLSNKRNAPTFARNMELSDIQNPGFEIYTIHPDEFKKIKEFGKQYGATINDMILALYYYTLKKISGNSNTTNRLTYSADLRIFMDRDDYDALSNFSAIHSIDIDNTSKDFVSLLKGITDITRTRKQMKYNLSDFPVMAMLFKTMSYHKLKGVFHKEFEKIKKGKMNASPGLTNMGIIEETKITFDSIIPTQAYMLGTVNHPGLFMIAVSTYKKHLTLSIGSNLNEKNKTYISVFIEELKTTINNEVL